jgi:alkylated DNA repair dioxygenase AlkB
MKMPFFEQPSQNLLPFDGEVYLYENFLPEHTPLHFFKQLEAGIIWKQEGMKMYGKQLNFPRLTAWYGEEGKVYKYSGLVNIPLPFSGLLKEIKEAVENKVGERLNAALLNLYRNGSDSMGWHCDDEKELGINPIIASVSFGETRLFQLKHKKIGKTTHNFPLPNNSFLLMKGATQHHWLHQIPKSTRPCKPRINITFRKIGE